MTYPFFYIITEILFFLAILVGIPLIVRRDKKHDTGNRILDLPNLSQKEKDNFAGLLGMAILTSFLPILREVVILLLIAGISVGILTFTISKALDYMRK